MNTTDTKTTSVSKVANVIIPVDDQDRMLAFYTEKLGLEKRADVPFGDDEVPPLFWLRDPEGNTLMVVEVG
jgi:catechol 2,3-dioxygenase-like lactoylglutathione lyase family enzyme